MSAWGSGGVVRNSGLLWIKQGCGRLEGVACRSGNVRIDALEFDVDEAKNLVRGAPLPGLVVTELAHTGTSPTQQSMHLSKKVTSPLSRLGIP